MQAKEYYLEATPQPWSGTRQLHAAGCALMPSMEKVNPLGSFTRPIAAMAEARRHHRKANGCYHCCKT